MAAVRGHQYFSLRWNNYQNTMTSVFQQLREDLSFVDVTLSCEHGSLKAHKVGNVHLLIYVYRYVQLSIDKFNECISTKCFVCFSIIEFVLFFLGNRLFYPPARRIFKSCCSRTRASIQRLYYPPTSYSQI